MRILLSLVTQLLLTGGLRAQEPANFGTKEMDLVNFKGNIYFLLNNVNNIPAYIDKMKSQGVIYTKSFDISKRRFTEGFPGVTERYEWFGILYTGTFEVSLPGKYTWSLGSDDGSKLWIDNKVVVTNDGRHPFTSIDGENNLGKGRHSFKLWYFQGPAMEIGLQLYVTPPAGVKKIFNLDDYSPSVSEALKKFKAVPGPDGIRIQLPENILFEPGKFNFKSSATDNLALIAEILKFYPGSTVNIFGYTDVTGTREFNQKLSENRARSVLSSLQKQGIPADIKLRAQGFGRDKPVAGNDTEAGKSQNRRVEIVIVM